MDLSRIYKPTAARARPEKYPISTGAMARSKLDAAEQGKLQVRDPQTGKPQVNARSLRDKLRRCRARPTK
jgi:hypothetical protein